MEIILQYERSKSKKKKAKKGENVPEEENVRLSAYPPSFVAFCRRLEAVKKRRERLPDRVDDLASQFTFTHPDHGTLSYDVCNGDAKDLLNVTTLKRRPYTLLIADIPFGFDMCKTHDDKYAWQKHDVLEMLRGFKEITSAPTWRVIIMHSFNQWPMVIEALQEECNAGNPEPGYWYVSYGFFKLSSLDMFAHECCLPLCR